MSHNPLVSEGESSDEDVPLASPIRAVQPGFFTKEPGNDDEKDDDGPTVKSTDDQPMRVHEPRSTDEDDQSSDSYNDGDGGGEEQIQNDTIKSKIPMNASMILSQLPESTNKVILKLQNLKEDLEQESQVQSPSIPLKITIRCNAIGSTPPLRPNVFKISHHQQFSTLIKFITKKLKRKEGVFVYLNNSFAPGPDEVVGNLYRHFGTNGELVVSYCTVVAFG